jgi:hypothetical protein
LKRRRKSTVGQAELQQVEQRFASRKSGIESVEVGSGKRLEKSRGRPDASERDKFALDNALTSRTWASGREYWSSSWSHIDNPFKKVTIKSVKG